VNARFDFLNANIQAPMVNLGGFEVTTSTLDNWTVTTKDRSLSAQWEHTILVTKSGYEILTLRDEEADVPVPVLK
jgi:methionyl aminopeptidase